MYAWQIIFHLFENSFHNLGDCKLQFHWEACHEIPSVVTKQLSYEFRQLLSFSYTFEHNYFHVIMYLSAGSVSTNKKNMNALQTRKKIATSFFLSFHNGSVRPHFHFCATSLCWSSTVNILEKLGVCVCRPKWLIGNSPTRSDTISPQPPNSITLKTRNVSIFKLSAK